MSVPTNTFQIIKVRKLSSGNTLNSSSNFEKVLYTQQFLDKNKNSKIIYNNIRNNIPINPRKNKNSLSPTIQKPRNNFLAINIIDNNLTPSNALRTESIYLSKTKNDREPKDNINTEKKSIYRSINPKTKYYRELNLFDKNKNRSLGYLNYFEKIPTDKVVNYYKHNNRKKKLIKTKNTKVQSLEIGNENVNKIKKKYITLTQRENYNYRNSDKKESFEKHPSDNIKYHIRTNDNLEKNPTDRVRMDLNTNENIRKIILREQKNFNFKGVRDLNENENKNISNEENIVKNKSVIQKQDNKEMNLPKEKQSYGKVITFQKINSINKKQNTIQKEQLPNKTKKLRINNLIINTNYSNRDKYMINEKLIKIVQNNTKEDNNMIKENKVKETLKISENPEKIINKSHNLDLNFEEMENKNTNIKLKKINENIEINNLEIKPKNGKFLIKNKFKGKLQDINYDKMKINKKNVRYKKVKKNADAINKLNLVKDKKNENKINLENLNEDKVNSKNKDEDKDIYLDKNKKEEVNLNEQKNEIQVKESSMKNDKKENEKKESFIISERIEIKLDNINPQNNKIKEEKIIQNNEEMNIKVENKEKFGYYEIINDEKNKITKNYKKHNTANLLNINKLEEKENKNKKSFENVGIKGNELLEKHPNDKIQKGNTKIIIKENYIQNKNEKINNEVITNNSDLNEIKNNLIKIEEKNKQVKDNERIIQNENNNIEGKTLDNKPENSKNNLTKKNENININKIILDKQEEENKKQEILNTNLNIIKNNDKNNLIEIKEQKLEEIILDKNRNTKPLLIDKNRNIENINEKSEPIKNSEFEEKNIDNNLNSKIKLNNENNNNQEIINENKNKVNQNNEDNNVNKIAKIDNFTNLNNNQSDMKEIPELLKPKLNLSQSHIPNLNEIENVNNYDTTIKKTEKQNLINTNVKINDILNYTLNKNKENEKISKSERIEKYADKKPLNKSLEPNSFKKLRAQFNLMEKPEGYFNPDDFQFLQVIGEGEFGEIFLVKWVKNDNQYYAMKKEKYQTIAEAKNSQMTTNIVKNFLKATNSEGVIKIFGDLFQKEDNIYNYYVLMEKAERDMEQELIIRCEQNQFYTEVELINVLCQLILAFEELQRYGIAHRDIKPQNILIIKGRYKISDFGEAIILNNASDVIQNLTGTELYMSPILFFGMKQKREQIKHNAYKSDVFSLGLCILLAATLNYDSLVQIRELTDMNKIKDIIIYYLSARYSTLFISFLLRMLEINEDNRPDFIQLKSMLVKKK